LRSEGKYINQLASTGSFRFTTNYNTKYFRYELKAHLFPHDILIRKMVVSSVYLIFESADIRFNNRQRLKCVYAESFKGNRVFADHIFRVNSKAGEITTYLLLINSTMNKFFSIFQLFLLL
jgi:hypothetical protein